jgi:hypothetical protein
LQQPRVAVVLLVGAGAGREPRFGLVGAAREREFCELGARGAGRCGERLGEFRAGEKLGNDHVVPGAQVGVNEREREPAGRDARLHRIVGPAAEITAQAVDVEQQGERMPVDPAPRERRLAAARGAVQQDQPGHAVISRRRCAASAGAARRRSPPRRR